MVTNGIKVTNQLTLRWDLGLGLFWWAKYNHKNSRKWKWSQKRKSQRNGFIKKISPDVAGFENGAMGPWKEEYKQPLKAGKRQINEFLLRVSKKNVALLTTWFYLGQWDWCWTFDPQNYNKFFSSLFFFNECHLWTPLPPHSNQRTLSLCSYPAVLQRGDSSHTWYPVYFCLLVLFFVWWPGFCGYHTANSPWSLTSGGRGRVRACIPGYHGTMKIREIDLVRSPLPGRYTDSRLKHSPRLSEKEAYLLI